MQANLTFMASKPPVETNMGFDPLTLIPVVGDLLGGLFGESEADILKAQRAAAEQQADAQIRFLRLEGQISERVATQQARTAQARGSAQTKMLLIGGGVALGGLGLLLWYRKTTQEED